MARTINYIERISEDFSQLDTMTQADLVCELFALLEESPKQEAWRRIQFGAQMAGIAPARERRQRSGVEVPPMMTKEEVGQCGALALAEPEVKQ